jgi:hypothetical protein
LKALPAIAVTTLTFCSPALAGDDTAAAWAVLERTKTASSTYTIHYWNRVTIPGEQAFEEGSAEFHQGDFHRIEMPRARVIADCRARTGASMFVETGEISEGPEVAGFACGINTNFEILTIELLPDIETKFGIAQQIRVTDQREIREYSVLENGILVRTTYAENRPGGQTLVVAEATLLQNTVPENIMFDKSSLAVSYLPNNIQP